MHQRQHQQAADAAAGEIGTVQATDAFGVGAQHQRDDEADEEQRRQQEQAGGDDALDLRRQRLGAGDGGLRRAVERAGAELGLRVELILCFLRHLSEEAAFAMASADGFDPVKAASTSGRRAATGSSPPIATCAPTHDPPFIVTSAAAPMTA